MECKINNLSIHYKDIGEGKPIIMLHGFRLDHRIMVGCMEPIFQDRDGYRRIYIDLPGMGQSESADWIENADVMLDILIAFINKILPNEKFLLVGESYGGYLARGLVHKMADRIDGLSFICPVIIPEPSKRTVPKHICFIKDEELLATLPKEEAEELTSILAVQNKRIYDRYKNEAEAATNPFLEKYWRNGYGFSFDVDKIDKTFDQPTLLIAGRQDAGVGFQDAWTIMDNYTRASFVVLDRAAHNVQLEQEEVYNSLVHDWLNRVEGRI
jgi:pimeloyl-ACP methyl ester carboxylesterase